MKILYAVQATGNGHISRACDVVPHLQNHGTVDVFLSGSNAQLQTDLPVKYRSKGLSIFYNNTGGLNYLKTLNNANLLRIYKEANELPLKKYDVVINDFECITSLSCQLHKKTSIHFGHQASFQSSKVPKPAKKDITGEFILKNYTKASEYVGLHFWPYDKNIFTPILRNEILEANPKNHGHITVYLGQFSTANLIKHFSQFTDYRFQIFCKDPETTNLPKNIQLFPINRELFTRSLINCHGTITGAGFETPAEVLYLNKKLIVIPIQGQYEQLCNAQALKEWNVISCEKLVDVNQNLLDNWYFNLENRKYQLLHKTEQIVEIAVKKTLRFL